MLRKPPTRTLVKERRYANYWSSSPKTCCQTFEITAVRGRRFWQGFTWSWNCEVGVGVEYARTRPHVTAGLAGSIAGHSQPPKKRFSRGASGLRRPARNHGDDLTRVSLRGYVSVPSAPFTPFPLAPKKGKGKKKREEGPQKLISPQKPASPTSSKASPSPSTSGKI